MNKRMAKFTLAIVLIIIVCLVLDLLNIPTKLIGFSIYNFSFGFWDMMLPVFALVIIFEIVYDKFLKRQDEKMQERKEYARFLTRSYFDSVYDAVKLVDSLTIRELVKNSKELQIVGAENCLCNNLLCPSESIYEQLQSVMNQGALSEEDINRILEVRKESNIFFTFAFTFCEREEMCKERKNQLLQLLIDEKVKSETNN